MRDRPPIRLYTLGHSTRPAEEFVRLLEQRGIRYAADVRRFPGSRRNPQFGRDGLERSLIDRGIVYVFLGRELGGMRREGYEEFMRGEVFADGVRELCETAARAPTAIFCAEALPGRCHRRYLADELTVRGFEVVHILGETRDLLHRKGTLQGPQRELLF